MQWVYETPIHLYHHFQNSTLRRTEALYASIVPGRSMVHNLELTTADFSFCANVKAVNSP
jgi:hypothetical protein